MSSCSLFFREAGDDDLDRASQDVCDYYSVSPCDFTAVTGFTVTYVDLKFFGPVGSTTNQSISEDMGYCLSMLGFKLTHCSLVAPYGDIDQGQHWLR